MASMPAPFFLGGLRKEGYVGTMGLSEFLGQLVKLVVLGRAHFITGPVLISGVMLPPFVIAGTVLGRSILVRVSERIFVAILEIFMVATGLLFIVRG